MKTLDLLPLLLAASALACGEGEVGGVPPGDSFDEARPLIYSEQSEAPGEKPPTTPERSPSQPDADPLGSPFGLEGSGLPSPGSVPPPGSGPNPDPVDTYCSYSDDACYYCSSYDECLGCWTDSATADTVCSQMFP
jgi:hypothetical protein